MKLKRAFCGVLAAGFLAASAGVASAATTFSFTATSPDDQNSIDFGDFTVTAFAGGLLNFGDDFITQNSNGLGVDGDPDFQPGQVDGLGGFEGLAFTFDFAVTLSEINFNDFRADGGFFSSGRDDYVLVLDGDIAGAQFLDDNPWTGSEVVTSFAVAATEPNDNWRLGSITYDPVAAVPLPAGFLLLLTGLGAVGLVARRRAA